MTRIVAGTHRGRPLRVPTGTGTRPTADRAREGLFSTLYSLLGAELDGLAVLDLYAGSGALGLEALSRGAASAVLIDHSPAAAAAIRHNVGALGLAGARVVQADVMAVLAAVPGSGEEGAFTVALLDPPYDVAVDDVLAALVPALAPGGLVALERRTRGPGPAWPPGLESLRSRRYGEATLWYGSRS